MKSSTLAFMNLTTDNLVDFVRTRRDNRIAGLKTKKSKVVKLTLIALAAAANVSIEQAKTALKNFLASRLVTR